MSTRGRTDLSDEEKDKAHTERSRRPRSVRNFTTDTKKSNLNQSKINFPKIPKQTKDNSKSRSRDNSNKKSRTTKT